MMKLALSPAAARQLRARLARAGVDRERIFPIHFRCTVAVDGRYITGIIESDDLTGAA